MRSGDPALKPDAACADGSDMANSPTRFDRITKVKAHEEEAARKMLSVALETADERRQERDTMFEAAFSEGRGAGDIADWALADLSHMRALSGLSHAEEKYVAAQYEADQARTQHTSAYKDLCVFERLVEHRREAVLLSRRRADQREMDELAVMLHSSSDTYRGV